ncbi:MAG TPA: hypothetical protein VG942_05710 [Hyphomonadaceae bacterium]|nr:hypothetical protein [Hyphomonadaceae bacterium]
MKSFSSLAARLGVGIVIYAGSAGLAFGQTPAAKPTSYVVPQKPFGQPDISGFWSNSTLTPMVRAAKYKDEAVFTPEQVQQIEGAAVAEFKSDQKPTDPKAGAEYRAANPNERPEFKAAGGAVGGYNYFWLDPGSKIMRVNGEPRTSLITTPDGQIPKTISGKQPNARGYGEGGPAGASTRRPYANLDYETRSQGERCIIGFGRNGGPPMFPNGFYNNDYQIIQTPKNVVIEVEMNHDTRIIRLNGQHRKDDLRPYFGDSIGHWDGDTLVVETNHIPQAQAFMGSWKNLTVTERFKRVGPDRLDYQFTVDDPTMWSKPWGGEYEFHPMKGVIYEYACHEGNYALPGILSGNKSDYEKAEAKNGTKKGKAAPRIASNRG